MKYFKKEFFALLLYTVILFVLLLISKHFEVDVMRLVATTSLYLSISNLVNKEDKD